MSLGTSYWMPKLYEGTGDWKAPFRPGEDTYLDQVTTNTSDFVF
ncbi:hypothetical protein [Streptomyces sp. cmx-4-7]